MHLLGLLFNTIPDVSFFYIYNFIASHETFDSVLFKKFQQTVNTIIKLDLGGWQGTERIKNTQHKRISLQNDVIEMFFLLRLYRGGWYMYTRTRE